ncbi:MAG: phenylalanine--tRNA ligase subunit beta [Chlamydiae bacterium]|nr:phenylalanine--tRNA ligase subunit beta [Chlamydiota bacterium]
MKIPFSWLKKYVSFSKSPAEVADLLTLSGLEVEKIELDTFDFTNVIIALILEISPHPDADKLQILILTDGEKKYQVVSGAPSLVKNSKVAFAKEGATLKGDDGRLFVIKKAKLKGIDSYGMLCSEKELGLSNNHDSVLTLPDDAPVGKDVGDFLRDPTLSIALTPNLGHCRSILGVARELSAHFNEPLQPLKISLKEDLDNLAQNKIRIVNESFENCFQYHCRVIQGIEVTSSPYWLKEKLRKAGIRSINTVVDIGNLVMHELGQPLHAFDYDKLKQKQMVIREATKGEKITTLDNVERTLPEKTLLISDGPTPVAIAGIMGGLNSSVTESTFTILLESAEFHPTSIRKSSKSLGLRTESSARFENEVDAAAVRTALDYAASLVQQICGGRILKGVVESLPNPHKPRFLTCRLSKINALLGTKFSLSEVESYLVRLGFTLSSDGSDLYQLKIPSYRNDISNEIDIIEEVARLYGYNNIPRTRPKHISSKIAHSPIYSLSKTVQRKMLGFGLQEFITCNLISPKICNLELESGLFKSDYIQVLHAKSEDQSVLRPSLLPGLITAVSHNQNQGTSTIAAFEIGQIHFREGNGFGEKTALGITLAGKSRPHHFDTKSKEFDFYDLKGILDALFASLLIPNVLYKASSFKTFHPKRQASLTIQDKVFGVIGELHPALQKKLGLKEKVLFAEIDQNVLEKFHKVLPQYQPLPLFPGSIRDITITMKRSHDLTNLLTTLENIDSPLLKKRELLDIYTGPNVSQNEKNVSFRFTYRDDAKTLSVDEVEEEHAKVVSRLKKFS